MGAIGTLLGLVVGVFLLLLLARLVLDWIVTLSQSPSPGIYKARDVTHRFSEPVLAPVRKVLPPIRAGGLQIDLAFTVVFIVALVLYNILI
ncbi:YggT family protein [Nocardia otitidiscaviarum]|uniref:YggT family protein n=2 Tax=Nocardiaceae TaxID=85025 RepID=UPI0004A7664D|nr:MULTISPECIES: YggT family protein [Nocardia]MBF6135415.1 YggT family protein [Nocardia otitidiscaviarum]MBF6487237.1 YggT family protein [Nocardia otitidiscaviarum]